MKNIYSIITAGFILFNLSSITNFRIKHLDMMSTVHASTGDTFKYFILPDTNLSLYTLPVKFKKPDNWLKAEEQRSIFEHYGSAYPDSFELQDVLEIIDTCTEFDEIRKAKSWCIKNYQQAFPHLVTRLSVKKKIGLVNTADLIISSRIQTSEMIFYGHGGVITEDLFTVAGRASWILGEITGEGFSIVHPDLTEAMAIDFKKQWHEYLTKLENE